MRKKIERLPHFDGIASSPSWHPSGKKILMTMSMNGNKDIYTLDLETKLGKELVHSVQCDFWNSWHLHQRY
jgi:TolB protein